MNSNRQENSATRIKIRYGGLIAGPLASVLLYFSLPETYIGAAGEVVEFSHAGRATLAAMLWMAIWWVTEAIDISATALLPLVLFPIVGISSIEKTAAPYGSDIIFLFMGGFILALSLQRWGLGPRIALITLKFVGTKPANMVGGFMIVTAMISAWVSNTATAAMMLPIAISVVSLVLRRPHGESKLPSDDDLSDQNFATAMMLGIAYAASIGGLSTIIVSPPNGILVRFIQDAYGYRISFIQWMTITMPLIIVFLPLTWFLLTRVLYPVKNENIADGKQLIQEQLSELGPMKRGEWITFFVFCVTVFFWVSRVGLERITIAGFSPFAGLSDAGIAMGAALALFVIPVDYRKAIFTMDWSTASKLPWGILILFGGGLSLASAVRQNGVAEFFSVLVSGLQGIPTLLIIIAVTTLVIFVTELTSNTASTATLVPLLAGLAPGLGVPPELLIFSATIAASCSFMLPISTPPNAIVFSTGHVTIPQMCKAGFVLNLIGIMLITILMYTVVMSSVGGLVSD